MDFDTDQLKDIEHSNILDAASVDRNWWGEAGKRFPNEATKENAVREGKLEHIDVPNEYFTYPSDIRKDQNLRLLRPEAKKLLFQICEDLDKRTGFSKAGIRLAVTSLYRGDSLQDEIVNSPEWYRAAEVGTSSHAAGA